MPRRKAAPADSFQGAPPAVPAIAAEVSHWRDNDYPGVSDTTRILLNHWFHSDHKLPNGARFAYYAAQREAIESLIYIYEVAKIRRLYPLYQRYIPAEPRSNLRLPPHDDFARYATKMATGSGKTKVMALAIAWQYFNAVAEADADFATIFLIIAPNVIVFERLRKDFAGGAIFRTDPVIPRQLKVFWDMGFYMRGDAERAASIGALYLTNVQQLYETNTRGKTKETPAMTAMLGSAPAASLDDAVDFRERIRDRDAAPVMVINDEAHHTHDPKLKWNESIRDLHRAHEKGVAAQLDFTATPKHNDGTPFAWAISDYSLRQAILDGIVKRPIKGVTERGEVTSGDVTVRYAAFLVAAVERWREYRDQLKPLGKKPLLFVMMNDTKEADKIGGWLRRKYPSDFGADKTLIIHTKRDGDIVKRDLDLSRKAAKEVDEASSPINAIVSVLMLREGWDVQNVTVIVGLRPYSATSNILPEQTIGRGLRLMFRDNGGDYRERVDIIGNPAFINFVDDLESQLNLEFETFDIDKDRLRITVIEPVAEKLDYDIALPSLTPLLQRRGDLHAEIEALDLADIALKPPLSPAASAAEDQSFTYHGEDLLTGEALFDRVYPLPSPQTSGEVVAFYARAVARELRLPSHFAALAPKVRDFLQHHAFGGEVDLDSPEMLAAISGRQAQLATFSAFRHALRGKLTHEREPALEGKSRPLSSLDAFPWSNEAPTCRKTVFNKVACDNRFEMAFAHFLDAAPDVDRFAKLPPSFGFTIAYTDARGNLRHYYPDFAVVDAAGVSHLVETKGREDIDVARKDAAALNWTGSATALSGDDWRYVKVLQEEFEAAAPTRFDDIVTFAPRQAGAAD